MTPFDGSYFGMTDEERDAEIGMRPGSLNEFVGQQRLRANLAIYIQASTKRGEALDHTLFHGPPGLGKTTLAYIMATELGVGLQTTSGPALDKPKDLAAILTQLEENAVLFIDEIHRLPTAVEEILYPALEDYQLDIVVGEGPTARSIKIHLKPFTLVGATTRASLLSKPLRDRFGINEKLDYYDESELLAILQRNCKRFALDLGDKALAILAGRCRGTPRVALQLLRRVRDFVEVEGSSGGRDVDITGMLERIGVDLLGLLPGDREYLHALGNKFGGGPTGLSTLAAALGENKDTLESYVEPYLIRAGLIERTPRGRMLTRGGAGHIGINYAKEQGALFVGGKHG